MNGEEKQRGFAREEKGTGKWILAYLNRSNADKRVKDIIKYCVVGRG